MYDFADPMHYGPKLWQFDVVMVHERFGREHIALRPFDYENGFIFDKRLIN